jgi:ribonuclease T1
VNRRTITLIAICAVVLVGGWLLIRTPQSPTSTQSSPSTPSRSVTSAPSSTRAGTASSDTGLPTCPLASLPREVADTVDLIRSDGPFPYPRNDGVVFGNREAHLPGQARGYYHEYTVVTPGASNRATRRVITGGTPLTDPRQYFYTADHYESFCLVSGIGGRS